MTATKFSTEFHFECEQDPDQVAMAKMRSCTSTSRRPHCSLLFPGLIRRYYRTLHWRCRPPPRRIAEGQRFQRKVHLRRRPWSR